MTIRDLAIIGGGPAGLVVASVAAQLGLRTTLVEAEGRLGGDCLHYGCVPSKALIRTAKVASLTARRGAFGLPTVEAPPVDMGAVSGRIADIVARIQTHDDPERFRAYGCEVLFGAARFTGPDRIEVDGHGEVRSRRFVIATGASAFVPPIPGLEAVGYLTNREIFSLQTLPPRLAVMGGGPIGVELAQAFARLGSRVTVLQRGQTLLPREDPEAAAVVRSALERDGVQVLTGTEVTEVVEAEGGKRLRHSGTEAGGHVDADAILVASGRRPNVDTLELERAGVAYGRRGIEVDARMRTSNRRIFAAGDVCGPYQFTHMAEHQAGVVIANAVFRLPRKVDYRVVPWVTFSDPELARVGLSAEQAWERGLDVDVLRFDFADLDRALVERESEGFAKLVVRKGKVLGATVVGAHGGELLHEIVLAMRTGARLRDITDTMHVYPTRSEVHRRAVNTQFGRQLFHPRVKTLVRWINRLLP